MYPVTYAVDYVEERSRLTTLLRHLIVIPWLIVGMVYSIAAQFATIFAWFAIVFTGKYPESLYNFNSWFMRYMARVNAFSWLLTDHFPTFTGDEDPNSPVHIEFKELDSYDRLKTLFRLIIAIPVMIVVYAANIVVSVIGFVAWLVIVVTGKQNQALQDLIYWALRYTTQATAYLMLMTETYPPISNDPPSTPPLAPPAAPDVPAAG